MRPMFGFGPGTTLGSCGAGRFTLGIESNGAVKACPSLPSDASHRASGARLQSGTR